MTTKEYNEIRKKWLCNEDETKLDQISEQIASLKDQKQELIYKINAIKGKIKQHNGKEILEFWDNLIREIKGTSEEFKTLFYYNKPCSEIYIYQWSLFIRTTLNDFLIPTHTYKLYDLDPEEFKSRFTKKLI